MTSSIAFTVPGAPRGKARARVVQGHAFTPRETLLAENEIKWYFQQAVIGVFKPWPGPVRLSVLAWYEIPKSWSKKRRAAVKFKTSKPDVDNIVKLVKDALNKTAWDDDSQVVSIAGCKGYADVAKLVVAIEFLEG